MGRFAGEKSSSTDRRKNRVVEGGRESTLDGRVEGGAREKKDTESKRGVERCPRKQRKEKPMSGIKKGERASLTFREKERIRGKYGERKNQEGKSGGERCAEKKERIFETGGGVGGTKNVAGLRRTKKTLTTGKNRIRKESSRKKTEKKKLHREKGKVRQARREEEIEREKEQKGENSQNSRISFGG